MIKRWNNFIKESVDHYWNYYYDNIKKSLQKIIETPDSEYPDGVNEKKGDLLHIFENDLKLEDGNHITKALNLYTEYVYNDKSKEIRKFLADTFGENISKWSDIREYTTLWGAILIKKNFKDFSEIILKILDLYGDIKDDFNDDGYPKNTDLSKRVESICIDSLDDSTLELFDVVESYSNLSIQLGYDKENMNLDLLQKITDEVYSVCGRISDSTGLKNTFIEFGDELLVVFEF
jgi:hypothetical protein